MTLVLTRQHLIEFSGRYDLVVDTVNYYDAGANFFIQSGQRWLDRNFVLYQAEARYYKSLALGIWYDLIPNCRAIQEVWVSNSTGSKWKLQKRDYGDILYEVSITSGQATDPLVPLTIYQGNSLVNPAGIMNGAPLNYTPIVLRTIPDADGLSTIDQFGPVSYTGSDSQYDVDGVIFFPPVSAGHVLEVRGLFYQPKLLNDIDKNYWTEKEEFVLVLAACRAIEISLRNQQGVADWESAIRNELQGVEFDLVDEQSAETHSMRG